MNYAYHNYRYTTSAPIVNTYLIAHQAESVAVRMEVVPIRCPLVQSREDMYRINPQRYKNSKVSFQKTIPTYHRYVPLSLIPSMRRGEWFRMKLHPLNPSPCGRRPARSTRWCKRAAVHAPPRHKRVSRWQEAPSWVSCAQPKRPSREQNSPCQPEG